MKKQSPPLWLSPFTAPDILVKAMRVRKMILHQFFLPRRHKMPFADKARCIPRFFECLWQEDALMVYFHVPIGNLQLRIGSFMARDPICKPYPSGIASGEDGGTAWRAHGTGGISITKCHSAFSEFINVWSFVKVTPHARQCAPAEIINQEEHHIRLFIYGTHHVHAYQHYQQ